jgi:site-specific DNA-methyltransferase (adenine-specific)
VAYRRRAKVPVTLRHKKDEWSTPRDRWAEWDAEFGFTLDPAATPENALCSRYFTIKDDGLAQDWGTEIVWCNPPYSRVAKWVEKGYAAAQAGATVVMLVKSTTGTIWWHEFVEGQAEVRFLRGRLRFGDATSSAPFPSALLVFRPPGYATLGPEEGQRGS